MTITGIFSFHRQCTLFVLFFFVLFAAGHTPHANGLAPRAVGSGTNPPPGALIVRQTNTQPGEYPSLNQAIAALGGVTGAKTIFIYPGTYRMAVSISYRYPLAIQGYTANPNTATQNQVTISVARSAAQSGGDAQSSAIWVRQNDFKMFNINVENTYGTGTDTQAVALTAQGARHVYSMCGFSSYQDTLYVQTTTAYFIGCVIIGAVDFIFGPGSGWFEGVSILVRVPASYATITAQKRSPNGRSQFVFNRSKVAGMSGVKPGSVYLGRPWSAYAAVTFQLSDLSEVVNPAGWIGWAPGDPRTGNVEFYEYQNQGPGAKGPRSIGKYLNQPLRIDQVLGGDYASWINA